MLLAPLDPAKVIGMKLGLFRQTFLRQAGTFAVLADGCAEDDAIIR